jgi:hypothetical protein
MHPFQVKSHDRLHAEWEDRREPTADGYRTHIGVEGEHANPRGAKSITFNQWNPASAWTPAGFADGGR